MRSIEHFCVYCTNPADFITKDGPMCAEHYNVYHSLTTNEALRDLNETSQTEPPIENEEKGRE